jgi:transposase
MILAVVDRLSLRLVPDELWAMAGPLIPEFQARAQGGGTAPLPARAVFTAIVYVLTSGCACRDLPPSFGVPFQTAHRRFSQWTEAGLWRRLHHAVLDELGGAGLIDWSRAIVDGACVRAKKGTHDRSQPSRSRQARLEAPRPVRPPWPAPVGRDLRRQHPRLPRTQTSRHGDSRDQVPTWTTSRKPGKLHADKAYDQPQLRRVRSLGIEVRIARKGIESKDKLGKHR